MHKDNLEKIEIHHRITELFNLTDNSFVRSDNRMHAYKLAQPAPKVRNKFAQLAILFVVILSPWLTITTILKIGDIDRASVYVSLAHGMEHPTGVDRPMENAAQCYRYTSNDDDDDQVAPTTDDRITKTGDWRAVPSRRGTNRVSQRSFIWSRLSFWSSSTEASPDASSS